MAAILDLADISKDDKLVLLTNVGRILWAENEQVFCSINTLLFVVDESTIEAIKYFIRAYQIKDFTYDATIICDPNKVGFLRPFRTQIVINGLSYRYHSFNLPNVYQVIENKHEKVNDSTIWLEVDCHDSDANEHSAMFVNMMSEYMNYVNGMKVCGGEFRESIRQYYIDNYSVNQLLSNHTKSARQL